MKHQNKILLLFSVSMVYLLFRLGCNTPEPKPSATTDTLQYVRALEREILTLSAQIKADKDKVIEAKETDTIYVTKYKNTVEYVKINAPDTCQPYINLVVMAADSVIANKDSVIERQDRVVTHLETVVAKQDTVIQVQKVAIKQAQADTKKERRKGIVRSVAVGAVMVAVFILTSVL